MKTKHIMLDIETLATRSDAAILSIGGVVFSLGKNAKLAGTEPESSFLVSVDRDFYLKNEFPEYYVDPNTVEWWRTQGDAAQEALSLNQVATPGDALDKMERWFGLVGFQRTFHMDGDRVWANPCQFDLVILRNAASIERTSDNDVPWHFRQETCMRTVFWMNNDMPRRERDEDLVAHRADHDAIAQARALQDFYKVLKDGV